FSSYDELVAELEQAQRALGSAGGGRVARGRAQSWFFIMGALFLALIAALGIFFLVRKPPENTPAKTLAKSSAQPAKTTTKEQTQARGVVNATGAAQER